MSSAPALAQAATWFDEFFKRWSAPIRSNAWAKDDRPNGERG
jgi:hypothetical protein